MTTRPPPLDTLSDSVQVLRGRACDDAVCRFDEITALGPLQVAGL